ncbi:flavodoxin [Candidatus Woesearchaeota archaeon]|nr:flavodoxin [Candidatus Woesearchaeota archaeon]
MKALVAYYSRTGNTQKVGRAIAKRLGADADDIIDRTPRKGLIGWLRGGRDALRKRLTIITTKKRPEDYDLVIIGTPVWAATLAPAARTYLAEHRLRKVAFFCTYGGKPGRTFKDMESLSEKPLATLGLRQKNLDDNRAVKEFCDAIKKKKKQR